MAYHADAKNHKIYNGFNGVNPKSPFLIGVAGGTASGKSTVCQKIMNKVGQYSVEHQQRQVICISQDSFYKELTSEERKKAAKGKHNFDHPDAFDTDLMCKVLKEILEGKEVQIPVYDFKSNCRKKDEFLIVQPADVVLFEGILVFYFPEIRELFHMKLFVDTDPDTRLSRRVLRDTRERGRELDQILHQYTTYVKPAFEDFCLPMWWGFIRGQCRYVQLKRDGDICMTKKYADVIIPRGADNEVAISIIVQTVQDRLSLVSPRSSVDRGVDKLSTYCIYPPH